MRLLTTIVCSSLVTQGHAALRSRYADRAQATTSGLGPDVDAVQSSDGDLIPEEFEEKLGESADRTISEMQNIHRVPNELYHTLKTMLATFLPRWRFNEKICWKATATVFVSVIWFSVYFGMIVAPDRSESLKHWSKALAKLDRPDAGTMHLSPELVLVFHHPSFEYGGAEKEVSAASIDRVMIPQEACPFRRFVELRSRVQTADHLFSGIGTPTSTTHPEEAVTYSAVRMAMLQDLFEAFQSWGFTLCVFSSVDDDEIFMCVKLRNVPVIRHYLSQASFPLQLQPDVVKKLKIEQDPTDPACSPPSIHYDMNFIERLAEHGILDCADEGELFKTFTDTGTFVNSWQLLNVMWDKITSNLDLHAARDEGFLVTFFPVHNPMNVAELKATWANWWYLWDLSFAQPLPHLRNYFGTRITFIFAWNGHYSKALLALVAIALLFEVVIRIGRTFFAIRMFATRQALGSSVVLVIWAKISDNLWHREQDFFTELWDLRQYCSVRTIRPQFHGEQKASLLDKNITEKQYPKHLSYYRQMLTGCFTVVFCGLVACCIFIWMHIFEGKVGIVSAVMLSLQIKVFEFIFHTMVPILTDFENHKYPDEYHDSLLWKLFAFDFVNNYCAFFSITIRHAWVGNSGCDDTDCLFVLRRQVSVTLSILCVCSIASMLMQGIMVRFSLWYEAYQIRKKTGSEMPKRYSLEEQAKYVVITEQEEVQNMLTLVISLGFVLLFGGVAPLVVPCCLCVFAMQLRAFAVFLTTDAQRPHPQDSAGIGNWHSCIRFLMLVGVFYAGLLFVAFGPTFKGTSLMAKSTGLVCFCLASAMLWALIDIACPATDPDTALLAKRRAYVLGKLMKSAGSSRSQPSPGTDPLILEPLKQWQHIVNAAWDQIPNLETFMRTATSRSKPV